MSTWARTGTGDLFLPPTGLGPIESLITDPDTCAAIRIQDGLLMFKNDWKIDTTQGMPWFQNVLAVKNPPLVAISNLLRSAILTLGAPVVIRVTQLSMAYVSVKRNLAYAFQAATNTGATIVGGSSGPNGTPFAVVE